MEKPDRETNWGKWGENDEIGTVNYITRDGIVNAARLVKTGKVFNLAMELAPFRPAFDGRIFMHFMNAPGAYLPEGIGGNEDTIVMDTQASTQWDGLSHLYYDGKMYNGYEVSRYVSGRGTLKNSIHLLADKIVTRGVLLDVARHKKVEHLARGYIITPSDLEATAKAELVEIRTGDCLLIRTGFIKVLYQFEWPMRHSDYPSPSHEFERQGEPGLGWASTQWLKEKEVALVAMDNMGVEVIPWDPEGLPKTCKRGCQAGPIHIELLGNQGMPLGELFDLEELAKDCAVDRQYEFLFVAPPLKILHGVASPLSPLVVK